MIGRRQVYRELLELAWPTTVAFATYNLVSVVDTIYLGQLGTDMLASVSLAIAGMYLLFAPASGLIRGSRAMISQSIGADDFEGAAVNGRQLMILGLMMGIAILLTAPFAPEMMWLLGATPHLTDLGAPYLQVRLMTMPLQLLFVVFNTWFSGLGETKTVMRASLVANGLNILLDPLFIFGLGEFPAMGAAGAALATAVGWVGGLVSLLAAGGWSLCRSWSRPRWAGLRKVIVLGGPIAVDSFSHSVSFTIVKTFLVSVGEAHLAAHVMVVQVIMVSFLPGQAIADATGVVVGQSLGARVPRKAYTAWVAGMELACCSMALCGVLFFLWPWAFLMPFQPDVEVQPIAAEVLRIAALFQVFDAIAMVSLATLNGAGETRFAMRATIGVVWFVKMPLVFFSGWVLRAGAPVMWLCFLAELVALSFLLAWRLRSMHWLRRRVVARASS